MSTPPRIWVLLGKGAGGNAQMAGLAEALGWPTEKKQPVYNALNLLPNALLGTSGASLDEKRSDPFEAPWPDLVIGASRRSAPIARWIRRCSGGHTKLVHLLHVQAPLRHFDLIITLPQYRLPERDNILHLTGALNRIPEEKLVTAKARWEPAFAELPRPWIALIVGGNSSSYALGPEVATRLAREASAVAREAGGSLLVSTTPRTPQESVRALDAAIDAPAYRYFWKPDDDANPYFGYLSLADRFIVTCDSASLPVEACTTGKPVQIFDWPRKRSATAVFRGLFETGTGRALQNAAIAGGVYKPARDFGAAHRVLQERGLVSRLGEPLKPAAQLPDDLGLAVAAIRRLMGEE